MDQNNDIVYAIRPLGERVASLETRQDGTDEKLDQIVHKLDELLELKLKGMGAVKLISILAVSASGLAGLLAFILNIFTGRH